MPPASISRVCAFSYQMITSLPADQLQTFSTAVKYSILFRRGQAPLETNATFSVPPRDTSRVNKIRIKMETVTAKSIRTQMSDRDRPA